MTESIQVTTRTIVLAVAFGLGLKLPLSAHEPGEICPKPPAALAPDCKICVLECQPATKKVYSVVRTEFCIKNSCRPFHGLWSFCGFSDCGSCEKRTRSVLVKKTIPAPPVSKCVLKDMPPVTRFEPVADPKMK